MKTSGIFGLWVLLMSVAVQAAAVKAAAVQAAAVQASPIARVEMDRAAGSITFLSWDTEGGGRAQRNLLRQPATATNAILRAREAAGGSIIIEVEASGAASVACPFDPRVTSTTILPADWRGDGVFELPAIINAPDFGPMLLRERDGRPITGTLTGSRQEKTAVVTLTVDRSVQLILSPLLLAPPGELQDRSLWPLARRGWLNGVQPCAQWGEAGRPFSAPAGMLGNNVISDPASASLWFYADQAFFTPEPAPGIKLMPLVRRTIEYWVDTKMRRDAAGNETGELTCYWDYGNFLDANAGPIIASWDYVEVTGDRDWLAKKIARLEMVADFLIRRDIDDDGLIEATQSGNFNTLVQPNRSCAWWDALNCGHKDAYTNALIYRAFRCMADLEKQLDRGEQSRRYGERADRLKSAYFKTLFNEKTGLLAWWKSADGTLHDYASPTTCGLAIEYGLVPADRARGMLDQLWKKLEEVKFTRFDLGVPPMLIPVRRADYLLPDAIGCPKSEDGTDTFGIYMNGGITAGQVLHFIAAHYVTGDTERGDRVLRAMLERQQRGEFQNGVTDEAMKGIDWTTWDGKPSGYEGYLADSFRFLQAVLLREPALRGRLYRPMKAGR